MAKYSFDDIKATIDSPSGSFDLGLGTKADHAAIVNEYVDAVSNAFNIPKRYLTGEGIVGNDDLELSTYMDNIKVLYTVDEMTDEQAVEFEKHISGDTDQLISWVCTISIEELDRQFAMYSAWQLKRLIAQYAPKTAKPTDIASIMEKVADPAYKWKHVEDAKARISHTEFNSIADIEKAFPSTFEEEVTTAEDFFHRTQRPLITNFVSMDTYADDNGIEDETVQISNIVTVTINLQPVHEEEYHPQWAVLFNKSPLQLKEFTILNPYCVGLPILVLEPEDNSVEAIDKVVNSVPDYKIVSETRLFYPHAFIKGQFQSICKAWDNWNDELPFETNMMNVLSNWIGIPLRMEDCVICEKPEPED
jgi:hypothetical protein